MEETVFGNILNGRSVSVLVVVGFLVRIYLKILKYSVCLNGNVDTPFIFNVRSNDFNVKFVFLTLKVTILTLKVTILTLNLYS